MSSGTGYRGTFVLAWGQTEIDGVRGAPVVALARGAVWRRHGEAVRIDGATGVLELGDALGARELRRRAARGLRKVLGEVLDLGPGLPEPDDDGENGFVLTDGTRSFEAMLVHLPGRAEPLVVFANGLPPAGADLWVSEAGGASVAAADPMRPGVICFTPGTLVRAEAGEIPVEALRPGDRIETRDNGLQEIQWIGGRRITGARLQAMPWLRPVRFRAGALGSGQPDRDLLVSPQHRVLIRGDAARALFNTEEVLVAASDLVNDRSILRDHSLRETHYVHLLTERHEVLWANGVATESFHPAGAGLDMIGKADLHALSAVRPELIGMPEAYGNWARRPLTAPEAALLLAEYHAR